MSAYLKSASIETHSVMDRTYFTVSVEYHDPKRKETIRRSKIARPSIYVVDGSRHAARELQEMIAEAVGPLDDEGLSLRITTQETS